jgi:tRNA-uridine 2-sulfurtransferase
MSEPAILRLRDSKPADTRVIVGMSGGVDSSVCALLLVQQGYQVEGLFMKNWNEDDGTEYCTAKADFEDAMRVCHSLNIRLHTANFAAEYWDQVFAHFLEEYRAGRTPNPDVICNREIKFKVFLEYAEHLGADCIATGHYARTQVNNKTQLLRGTDKNKDQSYFLYAVNEQAFARTLFPIGALHKSHVRQLAEQHHLVTHDKKDSTGICFIGERRFKDFLAQYIPAQPGDILDIRGEVVGHHQGSMYYTLGQRAGLGIGGIRNSGEAPWYVADKDVANNILFVVQGNDHPLLYTKTLGAEQLHWINGQPSETLFSCTAKTRYRQADQQCQLTLSSNNTCVVTFEQAQRSVTPGQSIVFYNGEVCLGGGVITAGGNCQ